VVSDLDHFVFHSTSNRVMNVSDHRRAVCMFARRGMQEVRWCITVIGVKASHLVTNCACGSDLAGDHAKRWMHLFIK
jgi:hypothetical protein